MGHNITRSEDLPVEALLGINQDIQAASVRPLGTGCHTGIGSGGVRTPAFSGASRDGARRGTGAAGMEGWRGSATGASQPKLKDDSLGLRMFKGF